MAGHCTLIFGHKDAAVRLSPCQNSGIIGAQQEIRRIADTENSSGVWTAGRIFWSAGRSSRDQAAGAPDATPRAHL